MSILEEIASFMQKGRARTVKELVKKAVDEGISAQQILDDALLASMAIVGEKFKNNEVFVPEVLVCARAMNTGVEVLKPYLLSEGVVAKGVAIIGTVKGDLHDIGKNIVKLMLESKGIEVVDLGVDVPAETFVAKAIEHNAKIICCSALLTTTMYEMRNVVEQTQKAGIRDKVKIMVGGAPITQEFCDSIGADYYTSDGASCADVASVVCGE